jgi:hypothetical protein
MAGARYEKMGFDDSWMQAGNVEAGPRSRDSSIAASALETMSNQSVG